MHPLINTKKIVFLKLQPDKWSRIDLNQVVYIETLRWNTIFYYENGCYEKCNYSLLKVQSFLPAGFERIHRSIIVNISYVEDVNASFSELQLKNSRCLKVGMAFKQNLRKYLFEISSSKNIKKKI